MTEILPSYNAPSRYKETPNQQAKARLVAEKLEATFIAEMLKAAGFGEQTNSFSRSNGEDQFASFHRQALADKIAENGGFGLAEHILQSILETQNGR